MNGLATEDIGLKEVGTKTGRLTCSLVSFMFSILICESTDALLEVV